MMFLSDDEKYSAVIANDENYDGIFYYAVKSTGIYCRPSCKSRAPKRENTLFFDSATSAENAGFRYCKRCRSDLLNFQPSKEIADKVKNTVDAMFLENIKLSAELDKVGLSQRQMIEVFKKEYGITPKAYADRLRLEEAKRQLSETTNTIIDIAMSLGFSGLSAFYRFFKENTGYTPKIYRQRTKKQ